MALTFLYDIPW